MDYASIFVACGAGVISFFSPCVLPLLPAYISFITGLSIEEIKNNPANTKQLSRILIRIISFVLGFSLIFILFGASASYLGTLIFKARFFIRIIGGMLIIVFGLHLSGIINIRFLQYEKKFHVSKSPKNILGPFFIGMAFAIGWTPCVGPMLGSILTLAATKANLTEGIILLTAYSIGLGMPFIIAAVSIHWLITRFSSITRHMRYISLIGGLLLIIIGLLMFTGKLF